jgi:hypothetical protein
VPPRGTYKATDREPANEAESQKTERERAPQLKTKMNRLHSIRWGVWIGLVVGLAVADVEGMVFGIFVQEGALGPPAILLGGAIAFVVIPAGAVCGAGFLMGERPSKPRNPNEAYPPAG